MSGRERRDRKRDSTDEAPEFHGPNSASTRDAAAAKKPKMGFIVKKPQIVQKVVPVQMKLGGIGTGDAAIKRNKPISAVAAAFNDDSDSEPEEMPPEAKMRMKNIGRETPTSAGPNSFGKTKQGFCDTKKVFEKNLKQAQETLCAASKPKS